MAKVTIKFYKTTNFFKYMVIQENHQILFLQDVFKILNLLILTNLTNLLVVYLIMLHQLATF